MKDEVEKLIAVNISLIIDEDVQLLVNGVPIFTITQEQRVYRAVVSNPKAPAALLALINKAQVEAVRAELEARLVELDLFEQWINRQYDKGNRTPDVSELDTYKLMRLEDLEDRLANLKEDGETE